MGRTSHAKKQRREKRIQKMKDVTDLWEEITPYHFRLFDAVDYFPTNNKTFCLRSKKWSNVTNVEHFIIIESNRLMCGL